MKVKELIEELQKYDQEMDIVVVEPPDGNLVDVDYIEIINAKRTDKNSFYYNSRDTSNRVLLIT